jgi:hypothetical protein
LIVKAFFRFGRRQRLAAGQGKHKFFVPAGTRYRFVRCGPTEEQTTRTDHNQKEQDETRVLGGGVNVPADSSMRCTRGIFTSNER